MSFLGKFFHGIKGGFLSCSRNSRRAVALFPANSSPFNKAGMDIVERDKFSMGSSTSTSLFSTIPPERIGLRGEYDYDGLAKRVKAALKQHFEPEEVCGLRVGQRGAVVVIVGEISSQWLLIRLVRVAMGVSGAAEVEINGVSVGDTLRYYLEVKPSKTLLGKLVRVMQCPV